MNITEFLTVMTPVVSIVILNFLHVLIGYLENTKELEAEMENINANTQNVSSEVDVLGFVYSSTKEELDEELSGVIAINNDDCNWRTQACTIDDLYYLQHRTEYVCKYCGTRYVSDESGFIPNCKNCGARLEKETQDNDRIQSDMRKW